MYIIQFYYYIVHSCASIIITGTKTLDSIAPLTTYSVSSFGGTFNHPVDGQPSNSNGGINWPYGPTAGYTMSYYSVPSTPIESTVYTIDGLLPAVQSTNLGKIYANGAPSFAPSVTSFTSMSPTLNTIKVPTLVPVVSTSSNGQTNTIIKSTDPGGIVAIIIGILTCLVVFISMYCFKEKMKDLFFGPKIIKKPLVDLKSGRYELGSIAAGEVS